MILVCRYESESYLGAEPPLKGSEMWLSPDLKSSAATEMVTNEDTLAAAQVLKGGNILCIYYETEYSL